MSGNLGYWYGEAFSGGIYSELPAQAIPYSKKNKKEFKQQTMDALESIGLKQMKDNLRFRDLYRMVEGKLSYSELSEVIPQLSEVDDALKDAHIPAFIKHYDILGIIIRALRGEYLSHADKFTITQVDEIASNEYIREKTRLLRKYIAERWNKELELALISQGFMSAEGQQFNSEEEKQQYMEQLEQARQSLTPAEIEQYMNSEWQTMAVKWADTTMEADTERFKMSEIDLQNLTDYLLTGRCFRHFRVGYDSYEPEVWSPLNTFYSQNLDVKYPQEGDYIGRVHYYSPAQIMSKYGHLLTKEEKEKIINNDTLYSTGSGSHQQGKPQSINKLFRSNFGETHIVPSAQHYDYNFLLGVQEAFGVPMAHRKVIGKDGNEEFVDVFLPKRFNGNQHVGGMMDNLRELSDNDYVRTDLIQVTEAYFVSYKKFGVVTFEDLETGRLTQETVTEELLPDLLKEYSIKTLRNITIAEAERAPEPNTIVWDYAPEVWRGVKINNFNTRLDESLYLDVEPLEFQIKGNSKIYQLELPVAGLISTGVAPLILPYQIGHNIAMNQMYNLLEKEIGLFFLFDISFLPNEFKQWGNTEDMLVNFKNVAKSVGLAPMDSSVANVKGVAGGMAQFTPVNLSYSAQIADRMQLAEFYKNKAFEQIGFNPQRLGAPSKHETAEGVRQSVNSSYSQTESFFEHFSDFKKRAWDIHISVAQYCQKEGKDISVYYTKSDATNAWLSFSDPDFHLRKFSIVTTSNSKSRKELETFKTFVLQNNTMGNDLLALADVVSADTMAELVSVARSSRLYQEKMQQQQHQQVMEQQQQAQQMQMQAMQEQWKLNEMSKEADRENKLQVEHIKALGRAADKDSDALGYKMINDESDRLLRERELDFEQKLVERRAAMEDSRLGEELKLKQEELILKSKELEERALKRHSDERIAVINKN